MTDTATAPQQTKGRRKEMVGRIVSNKMQKTVVVAVDKVKHHRLYKRTMRLTKKYYAHDDSDQIQIGDTVRIVETRPLSKLKRWRVAEVVRRGVGAPVELVEPDTTPTVVEQVQETAGAVVETAGQIAGTVAAKVADVVSDVAANVLNPNADEPAAEEAATEEDKPAPRRRRTKATDADEADEE
jgi:small subunit ribosomal protein S17